MVSRCARIFVGALYAVVRVGEEVESVLVDPCDTGTEVPRLPVAGVANGAARGLDIFLVPNIILPGQLHAWLSINFGHPENAMYPLFETTRAYAELLGKSDAYLLETNSAKALLCLAQDPTLEGAGYISEMQWETFGATSEAMVLPGTHADVLEAVYGNLGKHNPRLVFSPTSSAGSHFDVPVKAGEDLSLPLISCQGMTVSLVVDALPLSEEEQVFSYPGVALRFSKVRADRRLELAKTPQRWGPYRFDNGVIGWDSAPSG